MIVCTTTTNKKFLRDRARHIVEYDGYNYYATALGNIVRDNKDGTWNEIPKAAITGQHILLMPYAIASELFPEWFAANPETI